jgi:DNA-binding CsgD family transcriptional regulator
MSMGRSLPALELTAQERRRLSSFAASRSLPHAHVARARLVLWAAKGVANQEIAVRLAWSKATVGKS